MYKRQLETFLQVARLGSFSKAAQALYITPSAVIQQVNHLEEDFGAQLLVRTTHGVKLTPAGQLVYQEGQEMVRRSQALRARLAELSHPSVLTIGTGFLSQPQLFPELWAEYWDGKPAVPTRFVMMDLAPQEGEEIAILETVMFGCKPPLGAEPLPLCEVPLCLAAPPDHPLAGRKCLTCEDLRGVQVVTVRLESMHEQLSRLGEDLHSWGAEVILVDQYTTAVFNTCRVNGYLLQIPACWDALCIGMKAIPCAWDYKLPYGFYYRQQWLPAGAEGFLEDLRAWAKSGKLPLGNLFSQAKFQR